MSDADGGFLLTVRVLLTHFICSSCSPLSLNRRIAFFSLCHNIFVLLSICFSLPVRKLDSILLSSTSIWCIYIIYISIKLSKYDLRPNSTFRCMNWMTSNVNHNRIRVLLMFTHILTNQTQFYYRSDIMSAFRNQFSRIVPCMHAEKQVKIIRAFRIDSFFRYCPPFY